MPIGIFPVNTVITHHQGNFSLPQSKIIAENHSQSKCSGVQFQWTIHLQNNPTTKSQGILWKGVCVNILKVKRSGNLL